MNLHFDWTINVPVMFSAGGVILFVFKGWLQQRDFNRNLEVILGKRAPRDERTGLLGEVAHLQERTDIHEELIDSHHAALKLDRRHHIRIGHNHEQ